MVFISIRVQSISLGALKEVVVSTRFSLFRQMEGLILMRPRNYRALRDGGYDEQLLLQCESLQWIHDYQPVLEKRTTG